MVSKRSKYLQEQMFEIVSFFSPFPYCQLATCEIRHLEKSDFEIYSAGEARRPAGLGKKEEKKEESGRGDSRLYLRSSPASLEIASRTSSIAVTICFHVCRGNTALSTPGAWHMSVFSEVNNNNNNKNDYFHFKNCNKNIKIERIKCKCICYWIYLFYTFFSLGFFGHFFSLPVLSPV